MPKCSNCNKETKKLESYGGRLLCRECAKDYDEEHAKGSRRGKWLIRTTDGHILGPYGRLKLRALISDKKVVFLDEVSKDGGEWSLIKDNDVFKDLALKTDYNTAESTVNMEVTANKKRETTKPPTFRKDKKSHLAVPPKKRPGPDYKEEHILVPEKKRASSLSKWVPVFAASSVVIILVSGLVYYSAKTASNTDMLEKMSSSTAGSDYFNKYYIKGREFEEGGLYKDALQYYHRALAAKSDNPGVRTRKAAIDFLVMGNQSAAEKALQELYNEANIGKITDQDEQCDIKNFLGIIEAKKGNYQSAFGFFNQALVIRPTSAHIYYNIGRVLYKQENYAGALEYFRNAKKLSSSFSDAALYEGSSLMKLSKFREAYQIFAEATTQNPNARELYTLGAYSALRAYGPDRAFSMLKKVLSLDPYYYKRIFTPLYQIDKDPSIKDEIICMLEIIRSLAEEQKRPAGYVLAILYLIDENNSSAFKLVTNDVDQTDANGLLVSGMISFHQEHYDEAEKKILKSLEIDYSNSLAHLYAGLIFLRQNDLGQARNHFTKAQSTDEITSLYAMVLLGDVLSKSGYANEALVLWKKVISLDSRYVPAWERVLNFK